MRWLQVWWCRTYNKPMKDPLLQQYTIEDLYYEFKINKEYEEANKERTEQEGDKIEQEKIDAAMSWADEEEARELAEQEKLAQQTPKVSEKDMAWMQEQLAMAKAEHGEDFGEDIMENFNG